MQSQQGEGPALGGGQLREGGLEDGGHGEVRGDQLVQSPQLDPEAVGQLLDGPGRAVPQPGGGDANGERKVSAQRDQPPHRVRLRIRARSEDPSEEQCSRFGREHVQRERRGHGRGVESDEPLSAGDQHQGAARAGEQRTDLLRGGRVVEDDQRALVREHGAPQARPLVQLTRQRAGHLPGGPEQGVEGVVRGDRRPTGGVGVQVEVVLAVGVAPGHRVADLHG